MTTKRKTSQKLIRINKKKLDENLAVFIYGGLYIANKLLIIAAVLAFFSTIAAGGDGKLSDGNIKIAFLSIITCLFCAFCARLTTIFMQSMTHFYKKHKKTRKVLDKSGKTCYNGCRQTMTTYTHPERNIH